MARRNALRLSVLTSCSVDNKTVENKESAHLIVPCDINPVRTEAMIDCGATGLAFINERLVRQHHLPMTPLEEIQELIAADGHAMKPITETVTITMKLKDHIEEITMFVANIGNHDVILGIPWLEQHNPAIDWKTRIH